LCVGLSIKKGQIIAGYKLAAEIAGGGYMKYSLQSVGFSGVETAKPTAKPTVSNDTIHDQPEGQIGQGVGYVGLVGYSKGSAIENNQYNMRNKKSKFYTEPLEKTDKPTKPTTALNLPISDTTWEGIHLTYRGFWTGDIDTVDIVEFDCKEGHHHAFRKDGDYSESCARSSDPRGTLPEGFWVVKT